jgi:chromosomal replication initiator protein
MRLAIVKSKLEERRHPLDPKIADLIARRAKKNVRELEGIINKVIFSEEMNKRILSEDEVEDLINKTLKNFAQPVSDYQIIKAVADFFSLTPEDLSKRNRKKEVVEPRQITMYLLRDILDMSYPYIGKKLGRDHTTAIHAIEKITQEINKNSSLAQKINLIKDFIYKA